MEAKIAPVVQWLHEVLVHIGRSARYAVSSRPSLKAVPHLCHCWPTHKVDQSDMKGRQVCCTHMQMSPAA